MFKRFLVILLIAFFSFGQIQAHDFNEEAMKFILSNQKATLGEFETYLFSLDDIELLEKYEDTDARLSTLLSLPGKKYLIHYVISNPDYHYSEIEKQIENDPLLSELGTLNIWNFLQEKFPNTNTAPEAHFSLTDFFETVLFGIQHILGGMDHILFILTLILCLPKNKKIFLLVTIFTLAHSLTIILGGLQIFTLSSTVVEPMIVFSIILTGVYYLFQKVEQSQGKDTTIKISKMLPETLMIFTLGLFHGLGFAGFFSSIIQQSENITLPVIAFNIGVELGQLLIIIMAYTVLYFLYRKIFPKQKDIIKNIFCGVIIAIASYLLYGQLG